MDNDKRRFYVFAMNDLEIYIIQPLLTKVSKCFLNRAYKLFFIVLKHRLALVLSHAFFEPQWHEPLHLGADHQ